MKPNKTTLNKLQALLLIKHEYHKLPSKYQLLLWLEVCGFVAMFAGILILLI